MGQTQVAQVEDKILRNSEVINQLLKKRQSGQIADTALASADATSAQLMRAFNIPVNLTTRSAMGSSESGSVDPTIRYKQLLGGIALG